MKELTDLEICKRIAEIEGLLHIRYILDGNKCVEVNLGDFDLPVWEEYSPLTDDELCFQLMVKYKISVDFTSGNYSPVRCQAYYNQKELRCIQDENPNKAICLAIIEANQGR